MRRGMLAGVMFLAGAGAPAGCKHMDCEELSSTVEVLYSDPSWQNSQSVVEAYQGQGWDCDPEAIRSTSGTLLGNRYTCTVCR